MATENELKFWMTALVCLMFVFGVFLGHFGWQDKTVVETVEMQTTTPAMSGVLIAAESLGDTYERIITQCNTERRAYIEQRNFLVNELCPKMINVSDMNRKDVVACDKIMHSKWW